MAVILSAYVISWSLLIASEYGQRLAKQHLFFKGLTSFIFLVMTAYSVIGFEGERDITHIVFMCLGMLFCFFGDVFLSVKKRGADSGWFLLGAGFFMAAHAMFFFALCAVVALTLIDVLLVFVIAVCIFLPITFLYTNKKDKRRLLFVYSIFLGLLMSKGISVITFFGATPFALCVLIGAVLFTVSDIILIVGLFREKKILILPLINLLLYYSATMLLAVSVGIG